MGGIWSSTFPSIGLFVIALGEKQVRRFDPAILGLVGKPLALGRLRSQLFRVHAGMVDNLATAALTWVKSRKFSQKNCVTCGGRIVIAADDAAKWLGDTLVRSA